MVWMISAFALGAVLGVLGYYHSKIAYSCFTVVLGVSAFMISYAGDLIGNPVSMVGVGGIVGQVDTLLAALETLPMHLQIAAILFLVTFFMARIGVHLAQKPSEKLAAPVSNVKSKRARILVEHGYRNGEIP